MEILNSLLFILILIYYFNIFIYIYFFNIDLKLAKYFFFNFCNFLVVKFKKALKEFGRGERGGVTRYAYICIICGRVSCWPVSFRTPTPTRSVAPSRSN